jgi:hypothetical protein
MKETSVKAGGKQSSRRGEVSEYIGKRIQMEDSKSVPIGSPVGQNESSDKTERTNRRQEHSNRPGP